MLIPWIKPIIQKAFHNLTFPYQKYKNRFIIWKLNILIIFHFITNNFNQLILEINLNFTNHNMINKTVVSVIKDPNQKEFI